MDPFATVDALFAVAAADTPEERRAQKRRRVRKLLEEEDWAHDKVQELIKKRDADAIRLEEALAKVATTSKASTAAMRELLKDKE